MVTESDCWPFKRHFRRFRQSYRIVEMNYASGAWRRGALPIHASAVRHRGCHHHSSGAAGESRRLRSVTTVVGRATLSVVAAAIARASVVAGAAGEASRLTSVIPVAVVAAWG